MLLHILHKSCAQTLARQLYGNSTGQTNLERARRSYRCRTCTPSDECGHARFSSELALSRLLAPLRQKPLRAWTSVFKFAPLAPFEAAASVAGAVRGDGPFIWSGASCRRAAGERRGRMPTGSTFERQSVAKYSSTTVPWRCTARDQARVSSDRTVT